MISDQLWILVQNMAVVFILSCIPRMTNGCCRINKVEPLEKVIKNYDAWMSGIRRHQTDFRKSIQIIEEYEGEHYKISPLANFTSRDAWWYMKEHGLPQHPLWEKGYLSIGCWPCTRPIQAGDDERSGRWAGKSKKECGIHTFMKEVKPAAEVEMVTESSGERLSGELSLCLHSSDKHSPDKDQFAPSQLPCFDLTHDTGVFDFRIVRQKNALLRMTERMRLPSKSNRKEPSVFRSVRW